MPKRTCLLLLAPLYLLSASPELKYTIKDGEPPPAEVTDALRAGLSDASVRLQTAAGDPYLDFWFIKAALPASGAEESGATLPKVPHGTIMGIVRVAKNVNDRRGDRIPPGLYALRLSFHPLDGAHTSIAPQRDFLILTKITADTGATPPAFEPLMQLARQASGTNHPLSFSCWKQEQDFSPGLHKEGEADIALHVRIGDQPIAIIVAGSHVG